MRLSRGSEIDSGRFLLESKLRFQGNIQGLRRVKPFKT